MRIEIDQSGKIENTNVPTAIALSNHIHRSVLIMGKDKRELQQIFRNMGKPRIFVFKIFSLLIFILIQEHLKILSQIVIDTEYPERGHLIKDFLLSGIRRTGHKFDSRCIMFSRVGKKSRAHALAHEVYRKRVRPDRLVTALDVVRLLIK